ncbi:MAG: alpha/beta hydrolase [Polaromonas sp.]|nr:alpha/beta hydrolase [Polaromonas sp.]
MNYVTTKDNSKLYYKDWGAGRPVILLHGWPLSSDSWDDQAMAIAAAGYRTIAYDRRGFGRSSQPWTGYDYDTLADDLAAVIEHTGAQDAVLVGFSMGGGEVARYMSRHGGKNVSRAVLVSSVVPYMLKTEDNPEGVDQSVFDEMAAAMKADRAKFFHGFFKDFFGVSVLARSVSEQTLEWAWGTAMQASLKATLESAKSFATTDFRPDLAAFQVPTLVIHGADDKIVPIDAGGRPAARAIGNATLIEYDAAPHRRQVTNKDQLTRDLLDFIRR